MDEPNTMQGAEPTAEDYSAPDFTLVEESKPEANDQAGAPEGETSEVKESGEEQEQPATTEAPAGEQEPKAATLNVEKLREEFGPDLDDARVREALLREKNLQVGYNKKFMELAEERKAIEAERQTLKQTQEILSSDVGKLAMQLAKELQDPAVEARIRKAYESVQIDPNDPNKIYVDRQTEPLKRQLEEMQREREAMQRAQVQRQAEQTHQYIQDQAQAKGVNPDWLFIEVDKRATAHKLNGGDLTEPGLLRKLTEEAATEMIKAEEAKFQSRLEKWKKEKATAQESAPPPTSGGSAPASTQKSPGEMSSQELFDETMRILGG